MSRELNKEQRLAISTLKRIVKRALDADLVIVMQDGSVTVHFKEDWDSKSDMDCGAYGMKDAEGETVDPITSFFGIEH